MRSEGSCTSDVNAVIIRIRCGCETNGERLKLSEIEFKGDPAD